MLRVLVLFAIGFLLHSQTLDEVRRHFRQPPKSAGPVVRWWWPGGDVEVTELRREVKALDMAGFAGAEIQPFSIGLKRDMPPDVAARVNDYPTKSFYGKVAAVLDEAKSRGLFIDLTLGSGWPFGGGETITPELASLELRMGWRSVEGPTHFHDRLTLPARTTFAEVLAERFSRIEMPADWQRRWMDRNRAIAVLAYKGSAPQTDTVVGANPRLTRTMVKSSGQLDRKSMIILTKDLQRDDTLDWEVPAGNWQIVFFFSQPANLRVIGGVGMGPQLVIDHMNRAALEAHIDAVMHEAGSLSPYFGNVLRAVFCDSLEIVAELYWSDQFLDEFRRRRGYDLIPWLPFLSIPGRANPYGGPVSPAPIFESPGADKARTDYWCTVSELWLENFFQPLVSRAHRNHLKARVQAHGAPVDILHAYGLADIPETEQLFAGGSSPFLKAASSAAHIYGHPIVSSESFVHFGMAYRSTAASLVRDVNALIAAGINQIIYHGFPYYYPDPPDPGWFPFNSPNFADHFNPHAKIWADVPGVNAYISRLQYIAQNGTPVCRYAFYRPRLDYPNQPDVTMPVTLDYDYVNDDILRRSRMSKNRLVTPGGAQYETLVLPADDSAMRSRFQGLKIVIGNPQPSDLFARWKLAGSEFTFYYNPGSADITVTLPPGSYEIWDPHTGDILPTRESQLIVTPGSGSLLCRIR